MNLERFVVVEDTMRRTPWRLTDPLAFGSMTFSAERAHAAHQSANAWARFLAQCGGLLSLRLWDDAATGEPQAHDQVQIACAARAPQRAMINGAVIMKRMP